MEIERIKVNGPLKTKKPLTEKELREFISYCKEKLEKSVVNKDVISSNYYKAYIANAEHSIEERRKNNG